MRTEYEFVLPRGYVDEAGTLHRRGVMRLATARDELEPLRDPTILGADDPRLTIVVLSRVVQSLGTLPMITRHEIEGLFAADLAYLQDFYGVINFGSDEDIEALLTAQAEDGTGKTASANPPTAPSGAPVPVEPESGDALKANGDDSEAGRTVGRRQAIEEVPSTAR
jgi:hypothetical protein